MGEVFEFYIEYRMAMKFDVASAVQEMTQGHGDALEFCRCFFHWVHAMDDLVDQEGALSPIVRAQLEFLNAVATNPF
jgi:hypothetical protein